MKITIDSSEPLEDAIRVIGAAYGVTLTTETSNGAVEEPAQPTEPAQPKKAASSRRSAKSRSASRRPANGRRGGKKRLAKVSNAELRSWARENGHTVSDRGRIPASIATAYQEAQQS
ncbi:MAG TPA: histone-like nucleoid-structuring protein Lsr2 [Segeticoccus sp.]|uniref:Lsr2 family DNA-binding protein n=1 Tax=Segeticoccus sp. TaxID=2706531 RepID=UPI002D80DB13|nr:histone-like nucleoid-structuring protein Lsr2 [Segeticoccus sp.]HET8600874.1 histone-like nucleoid-structuring protein Lsr2 [Segeticoccus sp.]